MFGGARMATLSAATTVRMSPRWICSRVLARALAVAVLAAAVGCSAGTTASSSSAATGVTTPAMPGTSGSVAPGSTSPPRGADEPAKRSAGCTTSTSETAALGVGKTSSHTLVAGGKERAYRRFIPATYASTTALPIVVDLHGYIEGAEVHARNSDLDAAAAQHGFVNLTPQGTSDAAYWNAGPTADGPDDLGFLTDLLDVTGAALCVDLTRVYATGLSNGAMMSSLVMCRLSTRFAAVAPVAGLMMPHDCHPERVVPFVAFHGTADPLLSYDVDGVSDGSKQLPFTPEAEHNFAAVNFQSTRTGLAQWSSMDGCTATAQEERVTKSVTRIRHGDCRDGATIELYVIDGGGHTWPGSPLSAGAPASPLLGATTTEISANEVMWAFFERYHL